MLFGHSGRHADVYELRAAGGHLRCGLRRGGMKKAGSMPYLRSRLVSGAGRFVPVGPQALLS